MERFSEKDDEKFLDFWMEEVINNKLNYKEFGKIHKIDKVLFEKIFIFTSSWYGSSIKLC